MKKIIAWLIIVVMCLSLVACSNPGDKNDSQQAENNGGEKPNDNSQQGETDDAIMAFQNEFNISNLDVEPYVENQQKPAPENTPNGNEQNEPDQGKQEVPLTGNESEVERDGNGQVICIVMDLPDGNQEETHFTDGVVSKTVFRATVGSVIEIYFNESGIPIQGIETNANGEGITREYSYFSNGETAEIKENKPDGSSVTEITENDGSITTIQRDANGNETYLP